MRPATTLVEVVWQRAATSPGQLALIENHRGRWRSTTAGELADRFVSLALALAARGVGSGQRVAVLVGNRAAWVEIDLAVQCAGGIAVAVPAEDDDDALAQLLDGLDPVAAIVADPVTLQRLRGLVDTERLDPIPLLVQLGAGDDDAAGVDELVEDGRRLMADEPARAEQQVLAMAAGEPSAVTFTAGAGGRPRPIAHTSAALLAAARHVVAARRLRPQDVGVVALDPAHPFERAVTIYPALASGAVLAFAESESTIARAMSEVQPTFAHLPVDQVREVAARVAARFGRNRRLKRLIARSWQRTARLGRQPGPVARTLIGRPVLRSLGWGNLRSLLVTSTAVPVDITAGIAALGLEVQTGYAVVQAGGLVGLASRGSPFNVLDGIEVSTTDGELTVRGPVATADGAAVRTGDCGSADGRSFTVEGPAASRIDVAGRPLLGAEVERRLRESPYVALAVVRSRDGNAHADVEADRTAVGAWAAERRVHFTTYSSLVARDEVRSLIADEVARLAPEVMSHELLQRPLQQGRDITRTRTTVHRRQQPADADDAPTAQAEPASALE